MTTASLPQAYQSWSAQKKQEFLWNERILPTRYDKLPPLKKIDVVGLFTTILSIKMERLYDEAPPKWKKAIHAHASVAKVKLVPTEDTPFTGLFQGADYGLLRLSVTADPADRGFAPGLALKLLINGQDSANFSALVALSGQGNNYNFFANEFSNIVPEEKSFGPKFINWIFRRVTKFPRKLYLQDFATITEQGQTVGKPNYPYRIFLTPNPDIQFASSPPHDFREDLGTISPGTRLFSIYAVDPAKTGDDNAKNSANQVEKPEYRQQAQLIGYLETTSEFVTSAYGDSRLFFRHQRYANR